MISELGTWHVHGALDDGALAHLSVTTGNRDFAEDGSGAGVHIVGLPAPTRQTVLPV